MLAGRHSLGVIVHTWPWALKAICSTSFRGHSSSPGGQSSGAGGNLKNIFKWLTEINCGRLANNQFANVFGLFPKEREAKLFVGEMTAVHWELFVIMSNVLAWGTKGGFEIPFPNGIKSTSIWQGEKKWVSFAKMENIVPYLKALEQRKESIWFFKELKYQIADSVFHPWLPTGAFVLLSRRYSNFPVEW